MAEPAPTQTLEGGAYEIIRARMDEHAGELRKRLAELNDARKEVFGSIETKLIATERIATSNNCVPRDMEELGGNRFLFGYNVHIGLKTETALSDVFASYTYRDGAFHEEPLDLLGDENFQTDFRNLYKYYKNTVFAKFSRIGPHLFMVFQAGKSVSDIKTFKWLVREETLIYEGNRSDHEFRYPTQVEFEWIRTHRDLHRSGLHPHISIQDRLFVETIHGDLTIKVEDNTETGEGIYSEPVNNKDQTLDDAEVFYALVGNLILLKIRPYQEQQFRHFIFNEKLKEVRRVDAIADACVLLPDDHGVIFSNGYYLQSGESKTFPSQLTDMLFERRVAAPNGEDYLYVFYNRESGEHFLMSYNLIAQTVEAPITCHGFSFFQNGELAYFQGQTEPQKHHVIQLWQTPYVQADQRVSTRSDSFLFKLGNSDIVRCMAECHEVLNLLNKDDSYADLYLDIVKKTGDIIDSYFWVDKPEAFNLKEPLSALRGAAESAIDEFDKVVRLRKSAADQVAAAAKKTGDVFKDIRASRLESVEQFVHHLAALRGLRGDLIALKDVRYSDVERVEKLEKDVAAQTEKLSTGCVDFLLKPEALEPYRERIEVEQDGIGQLPTVAAAREAETRIADSGKELELLIEIVGNLKIEDSTQTTRIIENISRIYSTLNQVKAALAHHKRDLMGREGAAQFGAELKLLEQAVVNYLDLCDTPEKCDEYLTRAMVQLEELEGRFAGFDEFIEQLTAKREELYNAFESRKLQLTEARNKRATALATAADRILNGIQHRVQSFKEVNEIHGYFAADMMIERVRTTVAQLLELQDSTKADEIQSRLKTIREDAVRQLKDRQELYVEGEQVLRFGKHRFSVNTQELELTTVQREDDLFLHLTGTNFFEKIVDPDLLASRPAWDQSVVSENDEVYRAEYLAYRVFSDLRGSENAAKLIKADLTEVTGVVQQFMAPRYSEGYVKGVHDEDAAHILSSLLKMEAGIGLLRYSSQARALAVAAWHLTGDQAAKGLLAAKLRGFGTMQQLFAAADHQAAYLHQLTGLFTKFVETTALFDPRWIDEAAHYFFRQLSGGEDIVISGEADRLCTGFRLHLKNEKFAERFTAARHELRDHPADDWALIRDWVTGFVGSAEPELADYIDETTCLLLVGDYAQSQVNATAVTAQLTGLRGSHPRIENGAYTLQFNHFMTRLGRFAADTVPLFEAAVARKKAFVERERADMRLEEFKPRVLSSFVRNKLIDAVFLPMVGDNLAKQIGVAGADKRTDRMGLLLLVSPPGYGKTTLMEYIANRLGIVFMKINGPAIGHAVTSLDPGEAPNAAAREEMQKLALALEMGDNVMLYLDDIQHLNPELLQKFISLCDAQRKIEGVYKGRSRTYDFRGRKVAVVMAGNPYTESGEKFKIPDMLANRADTYNLGDIVGSHAVAFELSFLENALTSNAALQKLASRNQKDVYAVVKIAETGSREGVDFEANYTPDEVAEMVGVMKKLLRIRNVILKVNAEYIRSAAQADAYRNEPPFKLQGSYRNMNRMAEKILPVMNDAEVEAVIADHYRNEAQTLTTGAEANLLKFKQLIGTATPDETARWEDIKKTFKRNLLVAGADGDDPVSQVVRQLSAFGAGIEGIQEAIKRAAERHPDIAHLRVEEAETVHDFTQAEISRRTLEKIWALVEEDKDGRTASPSSVEEGSVEPAG